MSQTSPDAMSREELETELATVRDQVGDMQADLAFLKRTLKLLTDAELGESEHHPLEGLPDAAEETRTDLEDVQAAVSAHGEQLSAIADIGGKQTSKDEKVTAIATFAMRKSDAGSSKVLVDAGEIQGCVDCSRRYAYDLIDDLAEDDRAEWASLQKAETVTTGKGPREKKKALRIDCDALQESSHERGVVNKFTTRSPTGGS